jgi:hypothetical protein
LAVGYWPNTNSQQLKANSQQLKANSQQHKVWHNSHAVGYWLLTIDQTPIANS